MSRDFPFKEKGFPCKFLCFCMVVLPLCLLKFIPSYIEFFPTILSVVNCFDDESLSFVRIVGNSLARLLVLWAAFWHRYGHVLISCNESSTLCFVAN